MREQSLPILYVKTGCPWCREASDFLAEHGIGFRERNVTRDAEARAEMRVRSRQDQTPVLDWHGDMLTDFDVEELKEFLRARNVKFEDS
jgi:glutaredoxin